MLQKQPPVGPAECQVCSCRRPVSGQWAVWGSLSIYGHGGREGHSWDSPCMVRGGLTKHGWGVLRGRNLTLWDKNKLARDVFNSDFTGEEEHRESQMRSATGIYLLPLSGSCETSPKWHSWFVLESWMGCSCDFFFFFLQRERGIKSVWSETSVL